MATGGDSITRLWRCALGDAGLRDADDAVLHVFDGINTPATPGAMAVEPGACAWDIAGHLFPFLHQQQEHSFASRDVYEVLTYIGLPDQVQLAVLRHELEHVRQYRQSRFLLRASTAIMGGLEEHLAHLPSLVRSLYIALPTERAADAAGRRLAVTVFGEPPSALRGTGHDVLLFGPEDGPNASEIAWRMLANLMLLPVWTADSAIRRFEIEASRQLVLDDLSDALCPGEGVAIRSLLRDAPEYQDARRSLISAMEAVGPDDPPRLVRDSFRRLVLGAEAAARATSLAKLGDAGSSVDAALSR